MRHDYLFQYNIPADNQFIGRTDRHINVIAEWNGESLYNDGRPIVSIIPIVHFTGDLIAVKDWYKATNEMEKIAENHFAEMAKQKQIEDAKAVLSLNENPITERLNAVNL